MFNVITALITPWQNDQLDLTSLAKIIKFQNESLISAIAICGSTGEGSLLSASERNEIIKYSTANSLKPIIVGCGAPSTKVVLEQALQAQSLGASGLLIVAPYYCKPTPNGVIEHFKFLHDNTTLPIILYNNPGRCGIDMSLPLVCELFKLDRVVGIKDSTNDLSRFSQLRRATTKNLLCGDDILAAACLALGADGVVSAAANIVPNLIANLVNAWQADNLKEFYNQNQKLTNLFKTLMLESNPIAMKAAANLLGLCGDQLRLPLLSASAETVHSLKQAFNELNISY